MSSFRDGEIHRKIAKFAEVDGRRTTFFFAAFAAFLFNILHVFG
jgi:hypothetical protein